MFNRLIARMAERAVPPGIDPEQERVAAEAAENGIREAAWRAAVIGIIVLLAAGGGLYLYRPQTPSRVAPVETVKARAPFAEESPRLLQEKEELQKQLADASKERDDLQAKVGALEKERDTLQGKVTGLEGTLADANKKLQAAEARPTEPEVQPPSKPASASAPVRLARAPAVGYTCGDGRPSRNPADCKPAHSPAPQSVTGVGSFTCGDGRSVRDAAECRPAGAPTPPR